MSHFYEEKNSKELEPFLDMNKDQLELVFLSPSPDLNSMECLEVFEK